MTEPTCREIKIGMVARLYRDVDMNYRPYIWIDLYGNSYGGMPDTSARRKRLAGQLRAAAKWVEKP